MASMSEFNSVEYQTSIALANSGKVSKKNWFLKNIILPLMFLTFGFAGGYIVRDYEYNPFNFLSGSENQNAQNASNITPAKSEPTQTPLKKIRDYEALKSELEVYMKQQKGIYGVFVENLVGGESFGINETQVYSAASTSKVPINYMLYKKAEEGKINLDSVMTYTKADYEVGTGILLKAKIGSKYTLRRLSELSITVSDNIATNMIIRALGGFRTYRKYMKEIGGSAVDEKKNVSSPADMALYLKLTYEFSSSNPDMGGEIIKNLSNTIFADRIPKLLPSDLKIAHKIGGVAGSYHDVGIVYTDEPYIISIMSKGVISEPAVLNAISTISKKVYDYEMSLR